MKKRDRKKPSGIPSGLKYLVPEAGQSGDDIEPLPYVSTEPEMRDAERPFRELTRAVKAGTATPQMARDYSRGAATVIQSVHSLFVTGKKIRRATSKAHEGLYGTPEEKRARWADLQRLVNEKLEQNPKMTHWRACVLVARGQKKGKASAPKTVYRHTKDPRSEKK